MVYSGIAFPWGAAMVATGMGAVEGTAGVAAEVTGDLAEMQPVPVG